MRSKYFEKIERLLHLIVPNGKITGIDTLQVIKYNEFQDCLGIQLESFIDFVIIPRLSVDFLTTTWYCIPFTEKSKWVLRDELIAFIGKSYSDFVGNFHLVQEDDIMSKEVNSISGLPFFLLNAKDGCEIDLYIKFTQLIKLELNRPKMKFLSVSSTSRLIDQFNICLNKREFERANELLVEIKSRGDVTKTNGMFLEVKYFHFREQFSEILKPSRMEILLDIFKPTSITEFILNAVYECKLKHFEESNRFDEGFEFYKNNISPMYGRLINFNDSFKLESVMKLFLYELRRDKNPNKYIFEEIKKREIQSNREQETIRSLSELVKFPEIVPSVQYDFNKIRDLFDEDKYYDVLCQIYNNQVNPDFKICRLALKSFEQLVSIDAANMLISVMDKTTIEIKLKIEEDAKLNSIYLSAKSFSNDTPSNLYAWFNRLKQKPTFSNAVNVLDANYNSWIKLISNNTELEGYLNDLFKQLKSETLYLIKLAIPKLRDICYITQLSDNSKITIQIKMLDFYSGCGSISSQDLTFITLLFRDILRLPISSDQYQSILTTLSILWLDIKSFYYIDWFMDMIQILYTYPCLSPESRIEIETTFLSELKKYKSFLNPNQMSACCFLLSELSINVEWVNKNLRTKEVEKEINDFNEKISKKLLEMKVGIYTLDERAGRDAMSYYKNINKKAKIDFNHDTACTEGLSNMAKSSDVIVYTADSASHQAFNCINSNGGRQKIKYSSVGSSSIINNILEIILAVST